MFWEQHIQHDFLSRYLYSRLSDCLLILMAVLREQSRLSIRVNANMQRKPIDLLFPVFFIHILQPRYFKLSVHDF